MRWPWRALAATASALVVSPAHAEELVPGFNLSGVITYTFQEFKLGDRDRIWNHSGTLTLRPTTYIIAPWFITIDGELMVHGSDGSEGVQFLDVTGTGTASILPRSDFPTQISYTHYNQFWNYKDEYDGTSSGDLLSITNSVFGAGWSLHNSASLRLASVSTGSEALGASLGTRLTTNWDGDPIVVSLGYDYGRSTAPDGEPATVHNFNASVSYSYEPFEDVHVSSFSSVTANKAQASAGEFTGLGLQGVTTASWMPMGTPDWVVSGALRTHSISGEFESALGTSSSRTDNMSGYGSLSSSYQIMPGLRLGGSWGLGVSKNESESKRTESGLIQIERNESVPWASTADVALRYESTPLDIWGFDWDWGAGIDVSGSVSDVMVDHGETLSASQTLSRSLDLPWFGTVYLGGTQTVSGYLRQNWTTDDQGAAFGGPADGELTRGIGLAHSATLSQSNSNGPHWDMWHFSAADSRTLMPDAASYQILDLQYNRGFAIDRTSTIEGTIGVQFSRSSFDSTWMDSIIGEVGYREAAVFGIEDLSFSTRYTINPKSFLVVDRYGLIEQDDHVFAKHRLNSRLSYTVGKLSFSLSNRLGYDGEEFDEMIIFHVMRTIF